MSSLGIATRTDMFGPRCSSAPAAPPAATSSRSSAAAISFDSMEQPKRAVVDVEGGAAFRMPGGGMHCCVAFFAAILLSGALGGGLYAINDKGCFGREECEARFPSKKWNCTGPLESWSHVGGSTNGTINVNISAFPYPLNDSLANAYPDMEFLTFEQWDIWPVKGENLTIPQVWTSLCKESDEESATTVNITQAIAHAAAVASDAKYPTSTSGSDDWFTMYKDYIDYNDVFCAPTDGAHLECGFFAADLKSTTLFSDAFFNDTMA